MLQTAVLPNPALKNAKNVFSMNSALNIFEKFLLLNSLKKHFENFLQSILLEKKKFEIFCGKFEEKLFFATKKSSHKLKGKLNNISRKFRHILSVVGF